MRKLGIATLALAVLLTTGCWPRKKKPVPTPRAPQPAPQSQTVPQSQPPTQTLPEPETPPVQAEPAPPTQPPPAKETHPPPAEPKAPAPRPRPQAPQPPSEPVPQLGTMIPPDQQKQLEAAYAADLKRARSVLAAVGNRPLDPSRVEMMTRIRSFIRQAEDFHARDLAAAAELAQRARVLALDLEARSK